MGYSVEAYQAKALEDAKGLVEKITCQLLNNDDHPVSAIGALFYAGLATPCVGSFDDQEILEFCLILEDYIFITRAIVAGENPELFL